VASISASERASARVVCGGDLNVLPRPDDHPVFGLPFVRPADPVGIGTITNDD
jgi:hypothetical protein